MFRLRIHAVGSFGVLILLSCMAMAQEAKKASPADGHDIHIVAPHVVDGVVMGPFHHYCKPVSDDVMECLLYESTDPKALLVGVEYFIAKSLTRPNVRLDIWNKYYHDHAMEIATGRVKILDVPEEKAKALAEAAAKTDGIIFDLWRPRGANPPNGEVGHPQSVGHKHRTEGPGPVAP
ncbi:MAG: DUF1264 domain-containing protein [Nitrospinae bacterium]|nr:DUF1264 domain-containing protein [Nitrospinota bacterium]